jgi:hypothetical protein
LVSAAEAAGTILDRRPGLPVEVLLLMGPKPFEAEGEPGFDKRSAGELLAAAGLVE